MKVVKEQHCVSVPHGLQPGRRRYNKSRKSRLAMAVWLHGQKNNNPNVVSAAIVLSLITPFEIYTLIWVLYGTTYDVTHIILNHKCFSERSSNKQSCSTQWQLDLHPKCFQHTRNSLVLPSDVHQVSYRTPSEKVYLLPRKFFEVENLSYESFLLQAT